MASDTKFAFITETNKISDLNAKPTVELKELLERQDHLLKNRSLTHKLKDKGEKIKKLRDEIAKELETRKQENKILNNDETMNNSACEWKIKTNTSKTEFDECEEKDPLKILSENGQIPKTHIKRLIDKEKDTQFSFKPYNTAVSEKIKKIVPNAHSEQTLSTEHSTKKIHLDESLHLLTEQLSALKVFGETNRSRRANECINDILNESNVEEQETEEITDEYESKPGTSVNINLNM